MPVCMFKVVNEAVRDVTDYSNQGFLDFHCHFAHNQECENLLNYD